MRRESTLVRGGREQQVRRPPSVPCPRSARVLQQVEPTSSFTPGLPPAISVPTQLLRTVHQHPGKEGAASSSGLNVSPAMARPRQHGVGQAPDSGCVLLTNALVLAAAWLHQPRRPGASPARPEPSSRLAQVSVPFLASEEPVLPAHSSQGERPGMRTCV